MTLSSTDIKRALVDKSISIDPLDEKDIGPASVDVHIGNELIFFGRYSMGDHYLTLRDGVVADSYEYPITLQDGVGRVILPGQFFLVAIQESITIDSSIVAQIHGVSTLARMGLQIHTSGFIDPGWSGKLTLQVSNLNTLPIEIIGGMRIAQISFTKLLSASVKEYEGKYNNAQKTQTARTKK